MPDRRDDVASGSFLIIELPSGGYHPPPRTSHLRDPGSPRIPAGIVAVTASLSVRFLMRFFETNRLTPFAIYCTTAGAALTIGVLAT